MDKLKDILEYVKKNRRDILRWVLGSIMAAISVLLMLAFLSYCLTPRPPYQPGMNAAGVITMWLVILGTGIPGGLLLKAAILKAFGKKGPAEDSEDEEFEDDEEEDLDDEEEDVDEYSE